MAKLAIASAWHAEDHRFESGWVHKLGDRGHGLEIRSDAQSASLLNTGCSYSGNT